MVLALIIFIVILSLPFRCLEVRQNKVVLLTYLFVVGLHQLVAVINDFWYTVIGADADATSFNHIGCELVFIMLLILLLLMDKDFQMYWVRRWPAVCLAW